MEIGCGEEGNMQPFLDLGYEMLGLDLHEGKIALGKEIFSEHPNKDRINFICKDIYFFTDFNTKFDLI